MLTRRVLVKNVALGVVAAHAAKTPTAALAASPSSVLPPGMAATTEASSHPLRTWHDVRSDFAVDRSYVHLAGLLLASHPQPVREAIAGYRERLDKNPPLVVHDELVAGEDRVRDAAAAYFDCQAAQVALTDSTTMGLSLVYGGLRLRAGDEIVTTTHDHFVTVEALNFLAARTGAVIKRVALYDMATSQDAQADAMVAALKGALTDATRLVAVTWVHSSNGIKTPIRAMAAMLAQHNQGRELGERALLVVDGVHGFGVEDETAASLGCDVFVAGTHKWLFGPRGTGLVWASAMAGERIAPIIPSFSTFQAEATWGRALTPGGFHSFEHRWALADAFKYHLELGKGRVAARIHDLAFYAKSELAKMAHVQLKTPLASELSSGIVCFEVDGFDAEAAVERLMARKIIASVPPYAEKYVRLTPGLLNDFEDLDVALAAVRSLKHAT